MIEPFMWPRGLWEAIPGGGVNHLRSLLASRGLVPYGQLYFAAANHSVGLHNHGTCLDGSFHFVLAGEKEAVIYPPSEQNYLYIRPYNGNSLLGAMDPLDPQTRAQFPALGNAQAYHATLRPGDVLYMPDRCYHYFRYTQSSFAVNWSFNRHALASVSALSIQYALGFLTPSFLRSLDQPILDLKDWVAYQRALVPGHWGVGFTLDALVCAVRGISLLSISWWVFFACASLSFFEFAPFFVAALPLPFSAFPSLPVFSFLLSNIAKRLILKGKVYSLVLHFPCWTYLSRLSSHYHQRSSYNY